jgi:hypothetical protein
MLQVICRALRTVLRGQREISQAEVELSDAACKAELAVSYGSYESQRIYLEKSNQLRGVFIFEGDVLLIKGSKDGLRISGHTCSPRRE